MKVLIIHNYYRIRGGEDTYVDGLRTLLEQNGSHVVLFSRKSADIKSPSSLASTVFNLFTGNQNTAQQLLQTISTERPDIIHLNNIYPLITDSIFNILKTCSIPVVETIHTFRLLRMNGYINSPLTSFAVSLALTPARLKNHLDAVSTFIFPAQFAIDVFQKHLPIPKSKIKLISHWVFPPKKSVALRPKKRYFLFVGRLSAEKGIVELVTLFSRLPQVPLVVAGEGPLMQKLQHIKTQNITLSGFIPSSKALSRLYQDAIATIIPSARGYEFGPLVLLESFAHGTPVIVPKDGVFLERVTQRKSGFFYKPDDMVHLKNVIEYAVENQTILHAMKPTVMEAYTTNYTPQRYYEQLSSVYKTHAKRK